MNEQETVPVEPEWEYGFKAPGATWAAINRAEADHYCLSDPAVFSLVRRTQGGPWLPVEPVQVDPQPHDFTQFTEGGTQ